MLAPAWLLMIAYTFAADNALIEPHSLIVESQFAESIRSTLKSLLRAATTLSGIPGTKH
jgi:hypothetical protein